MPVNFNRKRIEKWKSKIFQIDDEFENFTLPNDSDKEGWVFSDTNLKNIVPKDINSDFTIAITNVPLENNYYSRRIDNNLIIITFFQIKEILENKNIPLENIILRLIYGYCLVYLKYGNIIPKTLSTQNFTHDETRGCLFDMNGIKNEVVYSCNNPKICSQCIENLKNNRVSVDKIMVVQKEIRRIRKDLFYLILDVVKKHPIFSLLLSSFTAIILGAIGSIIASMLYETYIKK